MSSCKNKLFQSTPPRGWRRKPTSAFCEGEQFQSTPPRGWRLTVWISPNSSRLFQSTPPRGWRPRPFPLPRHLRKFQSTPPRGWRRMQSGVPLAIFNISIHSTTRVETVSKISIWSCQIFQSTPPRGWRQQYYTITTTILQHISTNKSYPTPSNHGQPSLHTRKSVLIVQIFRCESPRKSMFASGSHQNTLYRFTARGQVRISAVLPH